MPQASSKSKVRTWFAPRFHLRTLFVFCAAICIVLAIIECQVQKKNQVVNTVRKLGGEVLFSHETIGNHTIDGKSASFLQSLQISLAKSELFRQVTIIDLSYRFTENPSFKLSDKHIAQFVDVPTTEELLLADQEGVTDNCLVHIAQLKQLRKLTLGSTGIQGHGLSNLSSMVQLKGLHLALLPLSDKDILPLASLDNLNWLNLSHTLISVSGLATIAGLPSLEKLFLSSTNITDKGIEELYILVKLKTIMLDHTKVTKQGCEELQNALPGCNVIHDFN